MRAFALMTLLISTSALASSAELLDLAAQAAKKQNVHECFAYTVMFNESLGTADIVGHDEDYPGKNRVPSRDKFLESGKKYSGATFTPRGKCDLPSGKRTPCNNLKVQNDDAIGPKRHKVDFSKPDLGLDWRFSHGFGIGMYTIGGKRPPYCAGTKTYGATINGKCMTVKDLLTPAGGVEAMVATLAAWKKHATKYMKEHGLEGEENLARYTFAAYGMGYKFGNIHNDSVNKRVAHYLDCRSEGVQSLRAKMLKGQKEKPSAVVASAPLPAERHDTENAGPAEVAPVEDEGDKDPTDSHTVAANPKLLPADVKARYLTMDFQVDGQKVHFQLDQLQYQNLKHKRLDRIPLKDKLLGLTNKALKADRAAIDKVTAPIKLKVWDPIFMTVVSGKGSPQQIATVLKLAARFRKELGANWKDQGDLSKTLKQFYWDNMGLDCNGFVGNYAQAIGSKFTPSTHIKAWPEPARRAKKLSEVRGGYAMVWKDGHHIAAIQGKRADGRWDVVESNGDSVTKGLGNTVWELAETGSDFMKAAKVRDGKKGKTSEVYLVALN